MGNIPCSRGKIRKSEKKNPTPPRNSRGIDGGMGTFIIIILCDWLYNDIIIGGTENDQLSSTNMKVGDKH